MNCSSFGGFFAHYLSYCLLENLNVLDWVKEIIKATVYLEVQHDCTGGTDDIEKQANDYQVSWRENWIHCQQFFLANGVIMRAWMEEKK